MKNKVIFSIILLVIILAISGMIFASISLKQKEINEDSHLVDLTYNELQQKVNNKESFILLISQTNCTHCLAYKPILKQVLTEYNIIAYEIRIDTLSQDERGKLNNIANTSQTPVTVFIENGEEINTSNRLVGEATADRIKSRLKAVGYIKD